MGFTDSQLAGLYLTATELVGDISLKYYAKNGNPLALALGTASYLGLEAIMITTLKNNKLSIVNGYWDGISNIATSIAGIAMGEHLTPMQMSGLVLISGGLFMLA